MTTSSGVTGWVWDLSCRRRSLCSTAAFLERRFGTFFSSKDFSISWGQKHRGILMNVRKGNWDRKMPLLWSPPGLLRGTSREIQTIHQKRTLVLCQLVVTPAKGGKRTTGGPEPGGPQRAQVQGKARRCGRLPQQDDSFYSNASAHLTLKSSRLAATLSLARSSTFSSSVKSHKRKTGRH